MATSDSKHHNRYLRWYFLRPGKIIGPYAKELLQAGVCLTNEPCNSFIEQLVKYSATNRNDSPALKVARSYYNGREITEKTCAKYPYKIELYLEESAPVQKEQTLSFPECLVADNENYCVIYKPAGYPTLPLRSTTSISAKELLEDYLGRQVHLPSRLDSETQGLLIASKKKEYHDQIQKIFVERKISKNYLAQVTQNVSWQEICVAAPIGRSLKSPMLRSSWGYHGKSALTNFCKMPSINSALINAQPISGRTHQIRVHLKYLGLQIIGDELYNSNLKDCKELNLICYQLKFTEPHSQKEACYQVPNKLLPSWLVPHLKEEHYLR